jgi:hypothetical protein
VLAAKVYDEPAAPDDALITGPTRDFLADLFLPWARENARRLKAGREWCLGVGNP